MAFQRLSGPERGERASQGSTPTMRGVLSETQLPLNLPSRVLGTEAVQEEARALLTAVQSKSKFFVGFDQQEVNVLEQCLSVIYLSDGDEILCRSQEGTFWCLVLEGSVCVTHSSSVKAAAVTLGEGELVGEMSLFTGGIRNADTVGIGESTLAVMSFAELEAFKAVCPELGSKLNTVLASACLAKLLEITHASSAVSQLPTGELHDRMQALCDRQTKSADRRTRAARLACHAHAMHPFNALCKLPSQCTVQALMESQRKLGWSVRSIPHMGHKAESLYRRAVTAKASRESNPNPMSSWP